jgi:hypothetical protein
MAPMTMSQIPAMSKTAITYNGRLEYLKSITPISFYRPVRSG